jgi:hypothetical protein
MRAVGIVLLAEAACGEPAAVAPDATLAACVASWSGNFTEATTLARPCASITGARLALDVPSTILDAPLAVTIDLGAAAAGTYTAATVAGWHAEATRALGPARCLIVAGADTAHHGGVTLALSAAGHGTLVLDAPVLAVGTSVWCGDPLVAHVEVAF